MLHVTFRGLVSALVLLVAFAAQAAHAQSVSVPFPAGFIGTVGQNSGKADNIRNFSTLGITQATFSQPSTNGQFGGSQGNDLSGTLRLKLSNGTVLSIPGAINWRITTGSTLHYFGFIPDPSNAAQTITYPGGTYTLDATSNYGLRKVGSTLAYPDGTNVGGNAALNGLLDELNAYLATVTASGPKITGPSGAAGAAASAKTVNEGTTSVHTLTANRPVTWSILGGTDAARFSINASTGALAFVAPPDFETPTDADANNTYLVTILATDASGYTGQQAVTVTVADLDEAAPRITGPSGALGAASSAKSVPENQTTVHGFTANETVTWSITGGADAARFAINATTGALTFAAAPDFEAPTDAGTNNVYDLVVTATDTAGNAGAQAVAVTITDLDELAPTITGPSGGAGAGASAKSVPENQTAVHAFMASEPVTWSIAGGADAAKFTVNAMTGALAFVAAPDFEAPTDAGADNVYDVIVRATDTAGNVAPQSVAVTVTNVDDTAPAITGPSGGAGASAAAKSVDEGTTAVHAFTASETAAWSITGGADAARFAIDPTTGVLTFVAAPDFEAPTDTGSDNVYRVIVTAADTRGNASAQTVAVTVADLDEAAPRITGPSGGVGASASTRSVDEAQTAVHAFTASEPVTWAIVGGADAAWFAVDPTTGVLTFVAAPDYEAPTDADANNVYLLTLEATDTRGNASQQTVAVTVIDVPEDTTHPVVTGPSGGAGALASTKSVNEGTVAVHGFTADETVTWSLSGGADAARFAIDPTTGTLTFLAAPDFEAPTDADADNVYLVMVMATDALGNATAQAVTVTVLDLDDSAPVITGPSGGAGTAASAKTVDEGTTAVHAFTAPEPVSWAIAGGTDAGRFAISAATGALTFVAAPDYEMPTDADTDNTYLLTVEATDSAGNVTQQTVTVTVADLDDTAPAITGPSGGAGASASAKSVNEGTTAVHAFAASEPVIWVIAGGADAALFAIHPTTGALTFVAAPDFELPADAGANNVHDLVLTATDAAGKASQQAVVVTVLDVNEGDLTPPVITGPSGGSGAPNSARSIPENQTAVTTLTADEAVTWAVTGGADVARFAIDPSTGVLTFVAAPDFEAPTDGNADNVYQVAVTATDAAGNTSQQVILVTMTDVAEDLVPPLITGPSGSAGALASAKTINEGATAVHAFTAGEAVTWTIGGGVDAAWFAIDPTTGALSFLAAPDYEAPTDGGANNVYDLTVVTTDAAGNAAQQTVAVTILDVVEGDLVPPAITGPSGGAGALVSARTINEGLTPVATLMADEAVTWAVVGGADAARFAIDPTVGALTFVAAPDFEVPADAGADNVYVLILKATDAVGNASQQTVTVTVADVAEDSSAPVVTGPSGTSGRQVETIAEGSTAVATLTADEAVAWAVAGGPDAGAFAVDPATGALTFVAPPDFAAPTDADGDNVYVVKVAATDASGNATEIRLAVTVTDTGGPTITGPSATPGAAASARTVDEGTTAIATFTTDEAVTWAIAGGPDAARFVLDPITGELRFAAPQDFEAPTDAGTDNVYVLVVSATDTAGNSSQQTVRVTVADVPEDRSPPQVTGPSGTGRTQAETVAEGTMAVYTFVADEAVAWSLGGADGDEFVIGSVTGELRFRAPPRFGEPTDADGDNVYEVSVLANDADGNESELRLAVRVTDTDRPTIAGPSSQPGAPASAITVDEGGRAVGTFTADEAVTWLIGGGADGGRFSIDPATGALTFAAAPDFEAPADADGDNDYIVVVTATDAAGNVSRQAVTVTVTNLTDTPSELFEERRDEVEAIIADVEFNHLRAAAASTQDMMRSARDRFIDGQRLRERCRDLENDLITTVEWDDEACSPMASRNDVPFDVHGSLEVGSSGVNGTGTFFGQSGNFEGTQRRIVSGDFQIVDDGEGIETLALNGRVAWERLISEDVMLGYFLGGGYGESDVEQGLSGSITKGSLSFGGYVVAEPTDDLYLDGFVSLGLGRNDLALSDDELDLEGDYDTLSLLMGGALSGVIERRFFEVRPELSVAYGLTDVGDVSLDATAFGTSEEVTASIDDVDYATVRFTPEVLIPLRKLSNDAALEVAPSILCEWADGDGERACGGGLRLGLRGTSEDGLTSVEVGLNADLIGDASRMGVTASITHRF